MKPGSKLLGIVLTTYLIAGVVGVAVGQAATPDAGAAAVVPSAAAPAEPPVVVAAPAADPAPTTESDPWTGAVAAARQGKWLAAFAAVLIAAVAFVRRKKGWLVAKVPFLRTKLGGVVLVFVLGVIGEVATAVATHNTAPPGLVALLIAAFSNGIRNLAKDAVEGVKEIGQNKAAAAAAGRA